jgi:hypothetical protein
MKPIANKGRNELSEIPMAIAICAKSVALAQQSKIVAQL